MNITKSQGNNVTMVTIKGAFNGECVLQHRATLEQIKNQNEGSIVFDVSNMGSIDSSGIGLLVYIYKRVKPQNVQMLLIGLKGEPLMLFKMLRMDKVLDCVDPSEVQLLTEAYL